MTTAEASLLLELPPGAAPEEIEARFLDLRTKLEEKIGRAPTPGLKEKYRASLTQITAAYETLILAADASSLPVLQRQEAKAPVPRPAAAPPAGGADTASPSPSRRPKRKSSGEFLLVSLLAGTVLVGGGWWVLSIRAENERQARQAAAAKAEAEQLAALQKQMEEDKTRKRAELERVERERLERQAREHRTRLAELNLAYESALRAERNTERELSDLQADLNANRASTDLAKRVRAAQLFLRWLRDTLPEHESRAAKVRAETAVSNRADDAGALLDAYAAAIRGLQEDIKTSTPDPEKVAILDTQLPLAREGDAVAANWVAYAYYYGSGIPKNERMGVEWARQAAAKGNARSQALLGSAHFDGRGVERDEAAGFSWFRRAAELKDTYAMFMLGYCHQTGRGTAKDLTLATQWYERAAAEGNAAAMHNLGEIHLELRDAPKAIAWFKRAADKGYSYSLFRLGSLHLGLTRFTDLDFTADEAAGLDYLRRAARAGEAAAQRELRQRNLNW